MFLDISNLSFYFSDKRILNNISFSLEKGKTIAIVGASGSGKSTLLRIISDILKVDNNNLGAIKIKGLSPEDYRKTRELAFMFQEPTLMPNLNVQKNIEFPLILQKKEVSKNEIEELIKFVGLEVDKEKLPSKLSGGMKTRVALARAFVTTPELLLLDEPFSSLDISWKFNLYEYLSKITKKNNTTTVLVTHDIQEAILLADKIFVLSAKGEKIKELTINRKIGIVFENTYINEYLSDMQNIYLELQSDIVIDGAKRYK